MNQIDTFGVGVRPAGCMVRGGLPLPGGQLVDIARQASLPVLFSANAFMCRDQDLNITRVRMPSAQQFAGLDAALDSAGFVAAAKYNGYLWSIDQYLSLAQAHDWAWYSSMDYCVEREVAGTPIEVMFRVAETCRLYGELRQVARDRGMSDPTPVLQGWTPSQYLWCADHMPIIDWPDLVGVGSMCRRHIHGEAGILAAIDALDRAVPKHVRFHLFGVKGSALSIIGQHPRIASVDSMAWDAAARRDHPTGRSMTLRSRYLLDWMAKANSLVAGAQTPHTPSLFAPEPEHVSRTLERWLDLVAGNEIESTSARWHMMMAGDDMVELEGV